MTSVVFPGQGSQYIGMSKDFYDNFKSAKLVFDEVEETTSIKIRDIIFNDSHNLLNQTNYTQLCIYTASYSIYKTLTEEFNINKLNITSMLGHSLGEYTALTSSNILNISDTIKLLKFRGNLMNSAVRPNHSGMAALIGINVNNAEKIIKDNNLKIEIANDNSPMQIVISGLNEDIDKSLQIFNSIDVKKTFKLNVSAAFHSKIMLKAQEELNKYIDQTQFHNSKVKIISNFSGMINSDVSQIKLCLKNQMSNRVRWTESIINLEKSGETKIIEIGPGKVLSGLIKRISKSFDIINIENTNNLDLLKIYE